MDTKPNETKPVETEQITPEVLTPEELDQVSGGGEPLGILSTNHNQNTL
jgi:hypothetical protein